MNKIKSILIPVVIVLLLLVPVKSQAYMNLYEMIQFFEIMTNSRAGRIYTEAEVIRLLNEAQQLIFPYMPDTILEHFIVNNNVRVDSSTFGGTTRISFFQQVMGDSIQMSDGIQQSEVYRYLRLYKFSENVYTT